MILRIAGICEDSIVDGPGLRLTVFAQGCPHACPGCHNPHTHDFSGGHDMDTDAILAMLENNPLLSGITLSGGEPFSQPGAMAELARGAHTLGRDVVTYTGNTFETLVRSEDPAVRSLLAATDILIDGPFISQKRSLQLLYRGSSNQRILDAAASIARAAPVEWHRSLEAG